MTGGEPQWKYNIDGLEATVQLQNKKRAKN